ncbi:GIY-YIG nuclease family protein [Motiliproteus sp. MSK22-1]|uniref:GIY-YIG nuclease family protein n=1 Tax=Motiliproteus sp. MSK22-1 TaxID=1897630 RepID=UPI0009759BE3|nr:GIY-YIG nuclease family protein [Motiliproteus sp. MSK22-1]OMH25539.1 hypothetical protein BGP75_23545 [Motiliproteus sp. MSK22-1]
MVVFKILNKVTGKNYVGSCRGDIFERWELYARAADAGLDFPLYKDIREHGESQFSITELDFVEDREELKEIELFHTIELSARSLRSYKFGLKDSVVKRCTKTQLDKAWQKEMSEQARAEAEKAAEVRSQSSKSANEVSPFSSSLAKPLETKPVSADAKEHNAHGNNRTNIDDLMTSRASSSVSASVLAVAQKRHQSAEKVKSTFSQKLASGSLSETKAETASSGIKTSASHPLSADLAKMVSLADSQTANSRPLDSRSKSVAGSQDDVAGSQGDTTGSQDNVTGAQNRGFGNQKAVVSQRSHGGDQASIDNDQQEREKSVLADGISLLVRTLGSAEQLSGLQQQTQQHVNTVAEALTESARTLNQLQIRQQHAALKAQEAAQAVEASLAANEALTVAHQQALDCSDAVLSVLKESSSAGENLTLLQNELKELLGRLKEDSRATTVPAIASRRNAEEKKKVAGQYASFGDKAKMGFGKRAPAELAPRGKATKRAAGVTPSESSGAVPNYPRVAENTGHDESVLSQREDLTARKDIENAELSSREKIIEIESSKLVNRLKQLDTLIQKAEPVAADVKAKPLLVRASSEQMTPVVETDLTEDVRSTLSGNRVADRPVADDKVEAVVSSVDQEVVAMPPARAWVAPEDKGQPEACLVKKEMGDATVIRRRSKRIKLASAQSNAGRDYQERRYPSVSSMNISPSKTQRQIPSRKKLSIRGR